MPALALHSMCSGQASAEHFRENAEFLLLRKWPPRRDSCSAGKILEEAPRTRARGGEESAPANRGGSIPSTRQVSPSAANSLRFSAGWRRRGRLDSDLLRIDLRRNIVARDEEPSEGCQLFCCSDGLPGQTGPGDAAVIRHRCDLVHTA
jgi:hypothetical protein